MNVRICGALIRQHIRAAAFILAAAMLMLTLAGLWVRVQAQEQEEDRTRQLSVLLLIDTSGSMEESDPRRLRLAAASYLNDFLAAVGQGLGLNFRLGAAAFNEDIVASIPDNVVPIDLNRFAETETTGDTDFLAALDYALAEIRSHFRADEDDERSWAVVLVTDGLPEVDGQDAPPAYFDEVKEKVRELEDAGAQVFLAGTGDDFTYQEEWRSFLNPGHFALIEDPGELYGLYLNWFSRLTNLEAVGDAERLEDGRVESFALDPFLEQLVVSVVKDSPAVVVTLRRPDGSIVTLPERQLEFGHAILSENNPAEGEWQISAAGGGIVYDVLQRGPSLRLTADPNPAGVATPIKIRADELSDLLREANEALVLVLEVRRDGELLFSQPMESLAEDVFEQVIPDGQFTEAGDYSFELEGVIDDRPVENLEYAPLAVPVFALPKIGSVLVDGQATPREPDELTVEPGQTLALIIEVTSADLLSDDLKLAYTLLGGAPVELETEEYSGELESSSYILSANIRLSDEVGQGNLTLQISGSTRNGIPFVDYFPIRLAPVQVQPTQAPPATISLPAIATSQVQPTTSATREPSGLGGTVWWLVPLFLASSLFLLLSLVLFEAFRNMQRRNSHDRRIQEARKDLERARIERDRKKNVRVAAKFLTDADSELASQIDIVKKDAQTILADFALCYRRGDSYEWSEFYDDLAKLFTLLDEHQELHLSDFAQLLFSKEMWGDQEQYFAVEGLYELLNRGFPTDGLLRALSKADPSLNRGLLFGALATALRDPSAVNFSQVKSTIHRLRGREREGYGAAYHLLTAFYDYPIAAIDKTKFEMARKELKRWGPEVLFALFADVEEKLFPKSKREENSQRGFPGDGQPTREADIRDLIGRLNQARKITLNAKYRGIPEADFLGRRIDALKQLSEQEQQLFSTSSGSRLTSGKLLSEIRPSLDLFDNNETRDPTTEYAWSKIRVPINVFQVGGTCVWQIHVESGTQSIDNQSAHSLTDQGDQSMAGEGSLQLIPLLKLPRLDVGGMEHIVIDIGRNIVAEARFNYRITYDTEAVKRLANRRELVLKRQVEEGLAAITVAHVREQRHTSTLNDSLYIVDRPLAAQDLHHLGIELLLPEEMARHINSIATYPQLISLRGLRHSGKTTNLRALRDTLRSRSLMPNGQGRILLVLELNLRSWFEEIGITKQEWSDREIDLWKKLITLVREEVTRSGSYNEGLELEKSLGELQQRLHDGSDAMPTIPWQFRSLLHRFVDRTNAHIVLLIDEADLFTYFGSKEIYQELVSLSRTVELSIVVCHDAHDDNWFLDLLSIFSDDVARHSGERKPQSDYYIRYMTRMLEEKTTSALLDMGGLEFTDLARKTVWVLTGGYAPLIQWLCQYLIDVRLDQAVKQRKDEIEVTVSADDVKDVAYYLSTRFPSLLEYLGYSFTPEEYVLMIVIAQDHIDLDTGLLIDVRYGKNSSGDHSWRGTSALAHDLAVQCNLTLDRESLERQLEGLLTELLEKQVLEQVTFNNVKLPFVRWRVGWFVRYLRDVAERDLGTLLDSIKTNGILATTD